MHYIASLHIRKQQHQGPPTVSHVHKYSQHHMTCTPVDPLCELHLAGDAFNAIQIGGSSHEVEGEVATMEGCQEVIESRYCGSVCPCHLSQVLLSLYVRLVHEKERDVRERCESERVLCVARVSE